MARKNKPLPEVVWLQPPGAQPRHQPWEASSAWSRVSSLIRDLIYAGRPWCGELAPWLVLAQLLPLLVVAPDCSWVAHAGMPGPATWSTPGFHPRRTCRLDPTSAPVRLGRSATQRDLVLRRAALYALAIPV